jgi:hypothetical protein
MLPIKDATSLNLLLRDAVKINPRGKRSDTAYRDIGNVIMKLDNMKSDKGEAIIKILLDVLPKEFRDAYNALYDTYLRKGGKHHTPPGGKMGYDQCLLTKLITCAILKGWGLTDAKLPKEMQETCNELDKLSQVGEEKFNPDTMTRYQKRLSEVIRYLGGESTTYR